MKIKVLGLMKKELTNQRNNEVEKYTSVLCEFDEDTAKWVKVPDYVCPTDKIKEGLLVDVRFSNDEKTKASVFKPIVDTTTGESVEE